MIDAGHDPRRFAVDLLERLRDLIVLQAVPDAGANGVVEAPGDVLDRMRDQADRIGTATLARYAEVVHEGLGEMRGATAPRLLLEVACARMLLPSARDTESAALQRIERIETRLDMSIPADATMLPPSAGGRAPGTKQYVRKLKAARPAPAPLRQTRARGGAPPAPAAPARGRPSHRRAQGPPCNRHPDPGPPRRRPRRQPDAAAVHRQWTTVLDKVRQRSRPLSVMLSGAMVRAVEDTTLVLTHESAPWLKRLVGATQSECHPDALTDALGNGLRGCGTRSSSPPPTMAGHPPRPPEGREREAAEEESMLAEAGSDNPADPAPRPRGSRARATSERTGRASNRR